MQTRTIGTEIVVSEKSYQIARATGAYKPMCQIKIFEDSEGNQRVEKKYFAKIVGVRATQKADSADDAIACAKVRNTPCPQTYKLQFAARIGNYTPMLEVVIEYDEDGLELEYKPVFFVIGPGNEIIPAVSEQAALSLAKSNFEWDEEKRKFPSDLTERPDAGTKIEDSEPRGRRVSPDGRRR